MTIFIRLLSFTALLTIFSWPAHSQEWRSGPLSDIDRQFMTGQRDALDSLARSQLGRQLNGTRDNDLEVLQLLLDKHIVHKDQIALLQGMGIVLGQLLKSEKGLTWVAYYDKLGRSRALQVPGFDKDFIFPVTQVSRRAEVGLKVDVRKVYKELEQAVVDIRNKPPL